MRAVTYTSWLRRYHTGTVILHTSKMMLGSRRAGAVSTHSFVRSFVRSFVHRSFARLKAAQLWYSRGLHRADIGCERLDTVST